MDAKLNHWRAAMADLMFSCAAAEADQAADLVTKLARLLREAPHSAQVNGSVPAIRSLASSAEADAAALLLAVGQGGYMLSQSRGGPAMATVVLGPDDVESHGEGPCPAIALVGALSTAFAAEKNAARTIALDRRPAASIN